MPLGRTQTSFSDSESQPVCRARSPSNQTRNSTAISSGNFVSGSCRDRPRLRKTALPLPEPLRTTRSSECRHAIRKNVPLTGFSYYALSILLSYFRYRTHFRISEARCVDSGTPFDVIEASNAFSSLPGAPSCIISKYSSSTRRSSKSRSALRRLARPISSNSPSGISTISRIAFTRLSRSPGSTRKPFCPTSTVSRASSL